MAHWRPALIPDLHGKRAIVTGSNSGIGRAAARELARFGAEVVLACRSMAKANVAATGIRGAVPGSVVETAKLDLADLASVRAFAAEQVKLGKPIDILVNNAGRMVNAHQTTAQGFELTLGGNHLGHFALTGLLVPLLLAAPAARVVTISSIAHKNAKLDLDDLQFEHKKYKAGAAYGQSKLANLMFGLELERRFRRAGVRAASIIAHPGVSRTGFVANGPGAGSPLVQSVVDAAFLFVGQDDNHGAFPTLFAATAPQAVGGHYYGPGGFKELYGYPVEVQPAPQALDEKAAERLWTVSEQLTGVRYEVLDPGEPAGVVGWMQDA